MMATKKKNGAKGDAAAQLSTPQRVALRTAVSLAEETVKIGILTDERPSTFPKLQPSKGLLACSGEDIYKKGNYRKGRYLFAFPGRIGNLKQATGGTIGQLADLDTRNPICYLDAEGGRYKLEGTVIPITNRFLTLQCNQKAAHANLKRSGASVPAVTVEDVFDKLVVFSKATWIGAGAGAPEVSEFVSGHYGCGRSASTADKLSKQHSNISDSQDIGASQGSGGRLRRTASRVKQYKESNSSDESVCNGSDLPTASEESSEEEREEVIVQRPASAKKSGATAATKAIPTKQNNTTKRKPRAPIAVDESESEEEDVSSNDDDEEAELSEEDDDYEPVRKVSSSTLTAPKKTAITPTRNNNNKGKPVTSAAKSILSEVSVSAERKGWGSSSAFNPSSIWASPIRSDTHNSHTANNNTNSNNSMNIYDKKEVDLPDWLNADASPAPAAAVSGQKRKLEDSRFDFDFLSQNSEKSAPQSESKRPRREDGDIIVELAPAPMKGKAPVSGVKGRGLLRKKGLLRAGDSDSNSEASSIQERNDDDDDDHTDDSSF